MEKLSLIMALEDKTPYENQETVFNPLKYDQRVFQIINEQHQSR